MSVELDPVELGFKRPFDHEVSQVLRLHNPNNDPVAFKVKTTAPKQYCVRPNSGKIDPGSSQEVQVLLQAMKEQPAPDARCRDKFLVQSVAISQQAAATVTEATGVGQIWSNIEQTAKSSIQERKIKVNFLPADGSVGGTTNDQVNGLAGRGVGTAHGGEEDAPPPAYSSPSPTGTNTSQVPVTPSRGDSKSVDDSSAANSTMLGGAAAGLGSAATSASNAISSAGTTVASAVPTNQEDLRAQVESLKAQLQQAKDSAAEGLRQRKPQEAAQSAVESVQQSLQNAPAPGGVPIQYVAALCLLCFILAYFFF